MDWEVLPPVEPTPCTEKPLWLARTGYVDQFDEWRPGSSWEGKKYVLDSTDPSMRVELRVTVYGKWSKNGFGTIASPRGRLRPHRWHALLAIEGFELKAGSGRCRTLRSALEAVEGIDIPPKLDELLRAFYGQAEASCVFAVEDGEPVPWATTFGRWGYYKGWPQMREFLKVRRDGSGSQRVARISTSVCGFAETCDDKARAMAEGVELWTSWIDKSRST